MKKKRVLIADCQELLSEEQATAKQPVDDGKEQLVCSKTIKDLLELEPDVIIIDTNSSDYDLSKAISLIRNSYPNARVITIGRPDNGNGGLNHITRNDNKSCLVMDSNIESIITSIEETYSGDIILSPVMTQKLSKDLVQPKIPEHLRKAARDYNLNPREIEILQLLLRGATNAEIAQALLITEITVKAHLNKIYDKLNVVNRYQATSVVIKKSIIPDRK